MVITPRTSAGLEVHEDGLALPARRLRIYSHDERAPHRGLFQGGRLAADATVTCRSRFGMEEGGFVNQWVRFGISFTVF
ncbi:hypothetical protein AK812_SmicGene3889 [Symbiodinium microadriaticum]|uniref:Uncharacterized protein n=1 Tax=Symbiodinium microadriaticum TaxID=2951 RepID=A0A1Q9EXT2_SYMMI|nr:hypothetical protein AK812_SmicGene3889 [Symbiodinium microadriaticum]